MLWSEPLSAFASGLAVWPGSYLLAGGVAKVRESAPGANTVLARLLPARVRLRTAWAVVAAAELAAGALVLAGVAPPFPQAAAAAGLAAAAFVSLWGVRNAPDAGCGCFGSRSEPVSPRTVLRAAALSALALAAALGGEAWWSALSHPAAIAGVLAAGLALAAVTPELRWRDTRLRVSEEVCSHKPASPRRTLARLRRSELWNEARQYLAADAPSEQWRDGCWRYVTYPARYDGEPATAVFALYLGRNRGADGVAFVDEREQRVLGEITRVVKRV